MTTAAFVKLVLATLVVLLAIDMVWLGAVAKGFYQQYLGDGYRGDKLERRLGSTFVEAPQCPRARSSCRVGHAYAHWRPLRTSADDPHGQQRESDPAGSTL